MGLILDFNERRKKMNDKNRDAISEEVEYFSSFIEWIFEKYGATYYDPCCNSYINEELAHEDLKENEIPIIWTDYGLIHKFESQGDVVKFFVNVKNDENNDNSKSYFQTKIKKFNDNKNMLKNS